MTEFSNTATASTTLTIGSLSTIASGAYSAASSLVDNTATTKSYLSGWVRLAFSATQTPTATAPYITLFVHEARDGTNLPSPPGTGANAPSPNAKQVIVQLTTSQVYQYVDFPAVDLGPFQTAFQIYNGTGATFTGTTTATLYRGDIQGI